MDGWCEVHYEVIGAAIQSINAHIMEASKQLLRACERRQQYSVACCCMRIMYGH